jgi:hypothetical protein
MTSHDLGSVALTLVAKGKGAKSRSSYRSSSRKFSWMGPHTIERCEEVTGMVLHAVFHALFEQGSRSRGCCSSPRPPSLCGGGRHLDLVLFAPTRACRGAWHRFPVGRPKRPPGDRPSERNKPAVRAEALEGEFLLRAGALGSGSRGLAWAGRESGGWPEGSLLPGQIQRGGKRREVHG